MLHTVEEARRIYNPVQKDYAAYIKTAEETYGEFSLLEVELAPDGGNALHRHVDFTEEFEVLDGVLNVQIGKEHRELKTGETALVPRNVPHRFYNASGDTVHFVVELRPGHTGFEHALAIAYGMAADGAMNAAGQPKNILELAYLVSLSGTHLTGALRLLEPLFGLLARVAHRRGVDDRLAERYLGPF